MGGTFLTVNLVPLLDVMVVMMSHVYVTTNIILQPINNLVLKMKYPGKIRSTPSDALASCITGSSTAMILNLQVGQAIIFHEIELDYFTTPLLGKDRQCKYILIFMYVFNAPRVWTSNGPQPIGFFALDWFTFFSQWYQPVTRGATLAL